MCFSVVCVFVSACVLSACFVYICIYVFVHICVCFCIHASAYVSLCISVLCFCACAYVYLVDMCIAMYVCLCTYLHVRVFLYTCTGLCAHACVFACIALGRVARGVGAMLGCRHVLPTPGPGRDSGVLLGSHAGKFGPLRRWRDTPSLPRVHQAHTSVSGPQFCHLTSRAPA